MRTGCLLAVLVITLSGCSEYKQSVPYEDGQYQGKTDQQHWDNGRFGHDREAWAQAVNERAQRQNEYNRSGDALEEAGK
jgi:outer membrane protein assembly factor BamE (lipoprotein component of BamABCDE complex)